MWNQLFIFLLRAVYVLSMEKQFSIRVFALACQHVGRSRREQPATKPTLWRAFKHPKNCPHSSQDFLYSKLWLCLSLPLFPQWLHLLLLARIALFPRHDAGRGNRRALPSPATANPVPAKCTFNISTWFWAWESSPVALPVPSKGFAKVKKWKREVRIWTTGFWEEKGEDKVERQEGLLN